MRDDTELSVYELGLIKNSLRERLVTIEEFRTDLVTEDEEEMNKRVDAFGLELKTISDKVEVIILNKLDAASQYPT
ncbi:hypothetical protein [uncultured Psychrobacter sp.]|uniref:hypothetical protein n=1 Tax=uncultured Psychrobacter sp. TaxID=259303 RepID=UPI002626824C|nr:hypothetical protein [uncultured Psychrobacter sp.]